MKVYTETYTVNVDLKPTLVVPAKKWNRKVLVYLANQAIGVTGHPFECIMMVKPNVVLNTNFSGDFAIVRTDLNHNFMLGSGQELWAKWCWETRNESDRIISVIVEHYLDENYEPATNFENIESGGGDNKEELCQTDKPGSDRTPKGV
jgi:hypothetical protein